MFCSLVMYITNYDLALIFALYLPLYFDKNAPFWPLISWVLPLFAMWQLWVLCICHIQYFVFVIFTSLYCICHLQYFVFVISSILYLSLQYFVFVIYSILYLSSIVYCICHLQHIVLVIFSILYSSSTVFCICHLQYSVFVIFRWRVRRTPCSWGWTLSRGTGPGSPPPSPSRSTPTYSASWYVHIPPFIPCVKPLPPQVKSLGLQYRKWGVRRLARRPSPRMAWSWTWPADMCLMTSQNIH